MPSAAPIRAQVTPRPRSSATRSRRARLASPSRSIARPPRSARRRSSRAAVVSARARAPSPRAQGVPVASTRELSSSSATAARAGSRMGLGSTPTSAELVAALAREAPGRIVAHQVEMATDHGDRRAQLMARVVHEPLLRIECLLQPVEHALEPLLHAAGLPAQASYVIAFLVSLVAFFALYLVSARTAHRDAYLRERPRYSATLAAVARASRTASTSLPL